MPGPVEDRLRLLRATRTHLSAVYGTVSGPCPPLADLLDAHRRQHTRLRDARRAGRAPPAVAARRATRIVGAGSRIDTPDRRRTPSLHDRARVPGRAARRRRSGPVGPGPDPIVDAGTQQLPVLPSTACSRRRAAGGRRRVARWRTCSRRAPTTTWRSGCAHGATVTSSCTAWLGSRAIRPRFARSTRSVLDPASPRRIAAVTCRDAEAADGRGRARGSAGRG